MMHHTEDAFQSDIHRHYSQEVKHESDEDYEGGEGDEESKDNQQKDSDYEDDQHKRIDRFTSLNSENTTSRNLVKKVDRSIEKMKAGEDNLSEEDKEASFIFEGRASTNKNLMIKDLAEKATPDIFSSEKATENTKIEESKSRKTDSMPIIDEIPQNEEGFVPPPPQKSLKNTRSIYELEQMILILPTRHRKVAISYVFDFLFLNVAIPQFSYQDFGKDFAPKNLDINENELPEKFKPGENTTYALSCLIKSSNFGVLFKEYTPPIARELLQISLWKYDNFGVVKIKDTYFTPKSKRVCESSLNQLEINSSLDRKQLVITESNENEDNKQLVILVDPFTLEVINEIEVDYQDDEYYTEDEFEEEDEEFDNLEVNYPTHENIPRTLLFGNGRYIITAVSKSGSQLHYYYKILEVSSLKTVQKIYRTRQLKDHIPISIQSDPVSPTHLYFCLFKSNLISIVKLDSTSGSFNLMAENKISVEEVVRDIKLSESAKNVFVNLTYDTGAREEHIVVEYKLGDLSDIDHEVIEKFKHSMPTSWQTHSILGEKYVRSSVVNEEVYFDIHGDKSLSISYTDEQYSVNDEPVDV